MTKNDDLLTLDATGMVEGFADGSFSPVDVMDATLRRAQIIQEACNAFVFLDEAGARQAAEESARRWEASKPMGSLDGVPIPVKDTGNVVGWRTGFGSRSRDTIPPADVDTIGIERLRQNGAIFFGKTTTPEFGWKGTTDGPATGVTRNPWDPRLTPGGSSGGSTAAIAGGAGAIGTAGDGGGSIRIPASFTGLVGLKPTFGRIPHSYSPVGSLTVFGVVTRTVRDTALALSVLDGPDPRDPFSSSFPPIAPEGRVGVASLRVALCPSLGFAHLDPELKEATLEAGRILEAAGAIVEQVDLDFTRYRRTIDVIWASSFASVIAGLNVEQRALLDPGLLDVAESASLYSMRDLQQAQDDRAALSFDLAEFHSRYDLILTAPTLSQAFEVGRDTAPGFGPEMFDWIGPPWVANLARQPAASVPVKIRKSAPPLSCHFIAAMGREDLILRAAHAIEDGRTGTIIFPYQAASHKA